MQQTIELWFPLPPLAFGVFLGVFVVYAGYRIVKFAISVVTGTS
jgi:hypothetical protein